MKNELIDVEAVSLVQDNSRKLPCVLLLDVSSSMSGTAIQQLNDSIRYFAEHIKGDSQARNTAEIAIVTFGSSVSVVQDFVTARDFQPPELTASGLTAMGQGIHKAADMISQKKKHYNGEGVSYFRPWIFMITDGGPTDDNWESSIPLVKGLEDGKKGLFWALGVDGADFETLKRISPNRTLKLQGLDFRSLFEWLSASIVSVSASSPGDKLALPELPRTITIDV